MNELNCHLNVITRHAHLYSLWKIALTCNVCCSEVELRSVVVEERCMTSTLVLGKDINLTLEVLMACYCARLAENLSSLDLVTVDTTEKSSDVITSLSLIKKLTEHLDTCNDSLLNLFLDTNDLKRIIEVKSTTLYTACSNCSTSCDGEYVLNRHKERLICLTNRIRDILINCIHELHDLLLPLRISLKSLKS